MAPAIDPARGTVELRFAVEEPPGFLRPDLTISINLDGARRDATVALPLAAVRDAASAEPWALAVVNDVVERRALRLGTGYVAGHPLAEVGGSLESLRAASEGLAGAPEPALASDAGGHAGDRTDLGTGAELACRANPSGEPRWIPVNPDG
ncbi:MAG: hypothetical protein JW751_04905, partial [Polyangiaceae bacterium]|nr:hypothetical protein [Polyangiaceae bacterium]